MRVEANLAGLRRQENEDNLKYVCTVHLDDPKTDGYWRNVVKDLEMSNVGDTLLDHRFRWNILMNERIRTVLRQMKGISPVEKGAS